MEALESLKSRLQNLKSDSIKRQTELQAEITKQYVGIFDADTALQADIQGLENSREYGADASGIYLYHRMSYDLKGLDAPGKEALEAYLSDNGITLDSFNDCLVSYEGESIVICGESGDVYITEYDGSPGTKIVGASEYTDSEAPEAKRNRLIEAYMESQGYFPGVFQDDRYGNIEPVNTNPKAE